MKRITTYCIILSTLLILSACTKEEGGVNGVWQRYGSSKGYQTDLAVGNIPGEPENRVYMCEHPGSPAADLYKGTISGTVIIWDDIHGLPDAEFMAYGDDERTLYFGVGDISDAGMYKRGVWTNTCGELKKPTKEIYYRWTEDGACPLDSYSLKYIHPNLPSNLIKNQYYGPISAGRVEMIFTFSTTTFHVNLSDPQEGYRRYYSLTPWQYDNFLNRCVVATSGLTYFDEPMKD